uniref:Gonadotropin-releasing hormone II receptor-like n=1 Tax=Diabrotica virgifera virgifera TaxID=50390 RepID=A0A6P7GC95_DIAVI
METEDDQENFIISTINGINLSVHNDTQFGNDSTSDLWAQPNFREISVYCVFFVVAAVGNLTVLISLYRSRHRKSRISLMITHLAIADLIVTFIMIPLEVGWRLTGRWLAGNMACKVFLFLRVLGPYLSSNILVCVSLDRYFAVLYPLRVNDARRRGKIMLSIAWSASFIYCIPQMFVFSVKTPPEDPEFTQCVSFDFFATKTQEVAYNFFCVIFMYFIPLFVIVVAYTAIMCEISRNSKSIQNESQPLADGKMRLRRSAVSNIEKAKSRTLKMTITIVSVYLWCCTPYAVITLWYMLDRESAERLPQWLQETFFLMVATNSCVNPIIYGSYVINCKKNRKYITCFNKKQDCHMNGKYLLQP